MKVIADLHLHSKYSRAVSPQMVIPEMAKWAKIKGINLLGTGDFTHPLWFRELQAKLEEEEGVLRIKEGEARLDSAERPVSPRQGGSEARRGFGVRFLLTAEISSIYSQGGKTRKIHNLVVAPSFSVAEKINQELKNRGCNLLSDGRPIIGLSAKDLLNLVLSVDEKCLFIPCHIWTPWFSLYGANSGFDSMSECFGDLAKYIYAVETGLSSDPYMNWQVEDLDNRQIVSFSDAHSPAKMGREATVFALSENEISNFKFQISNLSYEDVRRAILGEPKRLKISYTIEFYPEEGKYHYTGHRNCGVVQSPEETVKKGTTCPVCGKGLTVGVMERVGKLGRLGRIGEIGEVDGFGVKWVREKGDQKEQGDKKERPHFVKLVPLSEILAETLGVGVSSQKVWQEFEKLTKLFVSEIEILTRVAKQEIAKAAGEKLAEGIDKVRKGDIYIRPGYDGEYGKVSVWEKKGDEGDGARLDSAERPVSPRQGGSEARRGNKGVEGEQVTLF